MLPNNFTLILFTTLFLQILVPLDGLPLLLMELMSTAIGSPAEYSMEPKVGLMLKLNATALVLILSSLKLRLNQIGIKKRK